MPASITKSQVFREENVGDTMYPCRTLLLIPKFLNIADGEVYLNVIFGLSFFLTFTSHHCSY